MIALAAVLAVLADVVGLASIGLLVHTTYRSRAPIEEPVYVSAEFGGALPRLDRTERRELVVHLRAEGLSTRAIAAATGVAQQTVNRDLASGDSNESPAPITGTDGKTYEPRRPPITNDELDALKPERTAGEAS